MDQLPAECLTRILALTSPRDVCRLAGVSSAFRSAAASDHLWKTFLPSDYREILAQSSSLSPFLISLSERALYFYFYNHPLLIGAGNSRIAVDKEKRIISYMIGARDLTIRVKTMRPNWMRKRKHGLRYRFCLVARINSTPLRIEGKIEAKKLTPKTYYAAYLVFKFMVEDKLLAFYNYRSIITSIYFEREKRNKSVKIVPLQGVPREKGNGWMETEIGQFFVQEDECGSIILTIRDIQPNCVRGGLILEGIEVRKIPEGRIASWMI